MIFFWIILSSMALIASYFAVYPFIKSRALAIFLFLLIPLSSVSIYIISTNYPQFKRHRATQENIQEAQADIRQYGYPKRLVEKLEARVKAHPLDAKAWYFLGKLYLSNGENKKATQAFKKAKEITPTLDTP